MPLGTAAAIALVAAVALLGGLLATTNVASRVGRVVRFEDAVGAFRSASFDLGSVGVQPVLRADYITSVVGDALGRVSDRSSAPAVASSSERPPRSAPTTTTTTEQRGLVGRILTGDAQLSARMLANRDTVAPGEMIEYTVVLTNTGTSTIRGNIDIQSHVPIGTLDARRPCDSDTGVNVDPEHLCVSPAIAPGAGEQTHQVVITSSGRLAPGEERRVSFRVQVTEVTPRGTEISNHAHADLLGDGEPAVTTDPVVVVVS